MGVLVGLIVLVSLRYIMVLFSEVLPWDTTKEFYRDIDIHTCGLNIAFDGSLGYSYCDAVSCTCSSACMKSANTLPKQIYDNRLCKLLGPNCNGYTGRYYGYAGDNYLFLNTSEKVLYDVVELESSDEDYGWSMSVVARTGYMVHLYIEKDHKTAAFVEVPVKFHMIEYFSRSWGEGGTTGSTHKFPHFETFPIGDDEDVSMLMEGLKKMYWKHEFFFTNYIHDMLYVPKPLVKFFLRKNKKLWWAANKIAARWSRVYWSPYTRIGVNRLQKDMKKMGILEVEKES